MTCLPMVCSSMRSSADLADVVNQRLVPSQIEGCRITAVVIRASGNLYHIRRRLHPIERSLNLGTGSALPLTWSISPSMPPILGAHEPRDFEITARGRMVMIALEQTS